MTPPAVVNQGLAQSGRNWAALVLGGAGEVMVLKGELRETTCKFLSLVLQPSTPRLIL